MKRFTENQKWADQWFRKLDPQLKLLWLWLLDNCDHAGVIDFDPELAAFHIGYPYPIDTLSKLGERVTQIDGGKYFILKFIEFQYGELSTDCKGHNPVFASLKKHFPKGYPKGIHTPQDKDKDKDKTGGVGDSSKPTLESVKLCCAKTGLPDYDADWFWHKCEANGWTNGGRKIKSWQHTIAAWKAAGYMPSQKVNGKHALQVTRPVGGNF